MKRSSTIAYAMIASLLLSGAALAAQDSPAPPQAAGAASTMPPMNTTSMRTSTGEVTVNSAPASKPAIGTPPPFAQLSAGTKFITPAQAHAYPPLANDFIHADSNRDGTVDAAEYAHWLKQL